MESKTALRKNVFLGTTGTFVPIKLLGFVVLINWLQFPYVQERPRTPILDMVLILYTRAPHRTNDDVYVLFSKGFSGFVTDRVGCVWCF